MQRNAKKYMVGIPAKQKAEIIDEIHSLQVYSCDTVFEAACRLFEDKWRRTTPAIINFIHYLILTWVTFELNGWYEGFANGIPSHNNALEGTNGVIKDENSFRERFPLGQFLVSIGGVVEEWSEKSDDFTIY
jgi:hypothetical protein